MYLVLTEAIRFMAMAGVGVGMGIGPLAVHARFSQPEDRVAIVSALTLFVSSITSPISIALNPSTTCSFDPSVVQLVSPNAVQC